MRRFVQISLNCLIGSFIGIMLSACNPPSSSYGNIKTEILSDGYEIPFSIEIIDEENFLFTERMGTLYHFEFGKVEKVNGIPESKTYFVDRPYGGLMEVSLHPKFASNRLVYISYINPELTLNVLRFRLEDNTAKNPEIIFTSKEFAIGAKIAWEDDEHFFLSFGVGGAPKPEPGPQDLTSPKGKIFRFLDDGSIPEDNPVFEEEALPGIWSYGHRDPQGLYFDAEEEILYANEHGPLGGDEFNIIQKGGNYGWPLFSYGINYDQTPVSDMSAEEVAKTTILPHHYWKPQDFSQAGKIYQLAPSCLVMIEGSNFLDWNGSFLIGGLTYQNLVMYNYETNESKVVLPNIGRVRDVGQLPSGDLILLVDHHSPRYGMSGRLIKLSIESGKEQEE